MQEVLEAKEREVQQLAEGQKEVSMGLLGSHLPRIPDLDIHLTRPVVSALESFCLFFEGHAL
jgi:hypothetical protein